MYRSCTTECGHKFCQVCIEEYTLFVDQCAVCDAHIRRVKIARCLVADIAIEMFLAKVGGSLFERYQEKVAKDKEWFEQRSLKRQDIDLSKRTL